MKSNLEVNLLERLQNLKSNGGANSEELEELILLIREDLTHTSTIKLNGRTKLAGIKRILTRGSKVNKNIAYLNIKEYNNKKYIVITDGYCIIYLNYTNLPFPVFDKNKIGMEKEPLNYDFYYDKINDAIKNFDKIDINVADVYLNAKIKNFKYNIPNYNIMVDTNIFKNIIDVLGANLSFYSNLQDKRSYVYMSNENGEVALLVPIVNNEKA